MHIISPSLVLASAAKRQFFWVFLDHTDTAARLEQVLDSLAATNPEIVPLNPDQFVRLYLMNFPPPTNPVPDLRITCEAGGICLKWPAWATAWDCQGRADLSGSGAWAPLTNPVVFANSNFSLTLPRMNHREFFRLVWP